MPESPVSGDKKFSSPPPGAKVLSASELQLLVDDPLRKASEILGGAVQGDSVNEPTPEPVRQLIEVDEEDKRQYIRSLLAKEPFNKTYELFGGAMRLSFRTRTSEESAKVLAAKSTDKLRIRMLYSLVGIDLIQLTGSTQPAALSELDEIAESAVYAAFAEFEQLCDELFGRANDPDFWTRTAGRT